jgi:hypothetical protein
MYLAIRILLVAQQICSGVGCLTVEVSISHTQTYTDTLGKSPLHEGSARRPYSGVDRLTVKVLRSHIHIYTDTFGSLRWIRDRPVAPTRA